MFTDTVQAAIDKVDRLRETTDDHYQIPAEQGRVMAQILRIGRCRSMCEIGVSYGFSTLHLAAVADEHAGHVQAIDIAERKCNAARDHLTEAGLIDRVTIHCGDAREILPEIQPDEPFDFVFIDAHKEESIDYFHALEGKLAPRTILMADNTANMADEMRPFVEYIRSLPNAVSCDVPLAHGFELTILTQP